MGTEIFKLYEQKRLAENQWVALQSICKIEFKVRWIEYNWASSFQWIYKLFC